MKLMVSEMNTCRQLQVCFGSDKQENEKKKHADVISISSIYITVCRLEYCVCDSNLQYTVFVVFCYLFTLDLTPHLR